jgi:hypothetical protein
VVPDPIQGRFLEWLEGLEILRGWQIPRPYFQNTPWKVVCENVTLEVFGDVSERAYGANVYIRIPRYNGSCDVSLVISKAKVAPIKKVTLPRLDCPTLCQATCVCEESLEAF